MKRFFTAIKEALIGKPLIVRSRKWPTVRKNYLKTHTACAACGGSARLEVHHIKPFHLYRELELDPTNFIVLCEDENKKCHLFIGHNGNWKTSNLNVVEDAKRSLAGITG